jgi:hypothetical protein
LRKTKYSNEEDALTINTEQLMKMLNCGYKTAMVVAEEAKARVYVGRRVWFYKTKIEKYIEKISM